MNPSTRRKPAPNESVCAFRVAVEDRHAHREDDVEAAAPEIDGLEVADDELRLTGVDEASVAARRRLAEEDVMTDYRGRYLRLGPAPYLTDEQLTRAADRVAKIAGGLLLRPQ